MATKLYTFDYGLCESKLYNKLTTSKEGVLELFNEFLGSSDTYGYFGLKEGLISLDLESDTITISNSEEEDYVFIVEFEVV